MFKIDAADLKRFEKGLATFRAKALPHATQNALNTTAFLVRREWGELIKAKMVLRNQYTVRSLRVDKSRNLDLNVMQSVVGSVADYMDEQEDGGTKAKGGKHGVAIPTTSAAGQGMKKRPRTKQVQMKNRLTALNLANRVSGRRQRKNAVAMLLAFKTGTGVAFLDLGRKKGLFRILGTRENPRPRMIWDLTRGSISIPKNATLEPTLEKVMPDLPGIHVKAIEEQMRRHKILGY